MTIKETKTDKILIRTEESPVDEALIFICEKCGKKMDDSDDNPARKLQKTLKERIKESGHKGKARPMITSCLDICPDREIAICVTKPMSSQKDQFFSVAGDIDKLSKEILEGLDL